MTIIRDGKEYVMTDEEVFNAADAIIFDTNPHYKIKRDNKELELSTEEHRSCLIEWALSYKKRQYEIDKKKEMNKK